MKVKNKKDKRYVLVYEIADGWLGKNYVPKRIKAVKKGKAGK